MESSFKNLIRKAATKLEQFDFATAETLYREALAQRPGNAAAALGMAITLNRTGRCGEAQALLAPMVEKLEATDADPSGKAAMRAQLGQAQLGLGRPDRALDEFRRADRHFPSAELKQHIERLAAARGHDDPQQAQLALAERLRRQRRWGNAEQVYRALLGDHPDHPAALHGLALVMRGTGRHGDALALIQQAILLDPERPELLNDLGMLFQDRGQLEKAIGFHQRALRLRPDFVYAYNNLGVALRRCDRLEEAEQAYRKAIELSPDFAQPHNNLANLLLQRGRTEEAKRHLRLALERLPDYPEARHTLDALERGATGHPQHVPPMSARDASEG
ncbi:tetratricopeptide repeat protein [Endothiovibrio diazotrophicus]